MNLLSYFNIIIILALIPGQRLYSQERPMDLTLKQTLEFALTNNWAVRKSEERVGIAAGELRSANQVFLPNVQVSETFATTNNPLNNFGFRLNQSSVTSEDFDPENLNNPDRINNFSTRVQVQQPLINMDGIQARKAANASMEAYAEELLWTKNISQLNAKQLYFQLQLAVRQGEVLAYALETIKESYEVSHDLSNVGILSQADLLEAELRVMEIESHIINADNEISRINNELVHFLGLPIQTKINPVDEIRLIQPTLALLNSQEIPETRSDLKAIALQLKASEQQVKSTKSAFFPQLNAFGSYEWNDTRPFSSQGNGYLIGATLQWNIFKGGSRFGQMQKASAQQKLLELTYEEKLSSSRQQLYQIQNEIQLAARKLKVSEAAVTQAEKSYQIRNDRFQEGLETTLNLLAAETTTRERKLQHLNNINHYQQLLFQLEIMLDTEIINQ